MQKELSKRNLLIEGNYLFLNDVELFAFVRISLVGTRHIRVAALDHKSPL